MATYSKPKNSKPTPTPETTHKPINRKEFISSVIKRKTKDKFLTANQKKYYDTLIESEITYDTPITDDVLGYLSEDDVTKTLEQIQSL